MTCQLQLSLQDDEKDSRASIPDIFFSLTIWHSTFCYLQWILIATPCRRKVFHLRPSFFRGRALFWPTPLAHCGSDRPGLWTKTEHELKTCRKLLSSVVKCPDRPEAKLNPDWVEWLMGFPQGWTELEGSGSGDSQLQMQLEDGETHSRASIPDIFFSLTIWHSTACSLRWKLENTPGERLVFRLVSSNKKRGASFWGTPYANLHKDCGPFGSKSHQRFFKRHYLSAQVKEPDRPEAKLNPDWVEWLMGFPQGWTELEDSGRLDSQLQWINVKALRFSYFLKSESQPL